MARATVPTNRPTTPEARMPPIVLTNIRVIGVQMLIEGVAGAIEMTK
jgi:hypothetical protein